MERKIKKLTLNKKTISNLNLKTQNQIIGGATEACDTRQECPTNQMSCRECPTDHTYCGPCPNTEYTMCDLTCGWT
ncbi:hypothetical protein SAMN02927921_01577 [Sinomicrobium oceani]|uniref:Uncharacterized protein n=1 Tax=Sinomicrobium oceani TaxID=1150368 RepID=A0A1K1P2H1_9FLAO|nr:hypothetical protein SAMN02927921_01577 [Sinomicrobium oceani]